MGIYADRTEVTEQKSRQEIENVILRYGATAFAYATRNHESYVMFELNHRRLKFVVEMPADEQAFNRTPGGKLRNTEGSKKALEQEKRRKWRALALAIKAKLESVRSGISSFEEEFLANIVMPNGETVAQWATPQIAEAYRTGQMPQLTDGK